MAHESPNPEPARTPDGRPGQPTTYNILFVCTGNTCRSPLAAVIADRLLRERGWTHVEVGSAGIAAGAGAGAAANALTVAREAGLDLSGHRTRSLTPELLGWADLVLAMGPSHLHAVERLGAGEKASLITEFAREGAAGVPDPFGADLQAYRATYDALERAIGSVLDRLEPILSP
ncbi:MAG TPA: hypothetical protein VMK65_04565 [Longimicrobiales bacterium]|nr:hypothetical protein [Longimicrobiales bacterium]